MLCSSLLQNGKRFAAAILGAALVLTVGIGSVRAGKPPVIQALYNGELVNVSVNGVVKGNAAAIASRAANPLYLVPGQEYDHILSTVPGEAGYNPYWDIVVVEVLNGRDVSTDPFLSEQELLDAYVSGDVDLTDLELIVLCPVVSPQPPAFRRGHGRSR